MHSSTLKNTGISLSGWQGSVLISQTFPRGFQDHIIARTEQSLS